MISRVPATGRWTVVPQQPLRPTEPAAILARLRAEFPHFGILADPRRPLWIAVRGNLVIKTTNAVQLRERLLAAIGR
jgi:hypothetical protein